MERAVSSSQGFGWELLRWARIRCDVLFISSIACDDRSCAIDCDGCGRGLGCGFDSCGDIDREIEIGSFGDIGRASGCGFDVDRGIGSGFGVGRGLCIGLASANAPSS